jgi:hypothetical protein
MCRGSLAVYDDQCTWRTVVADAVAAAGSTASPVASETMLPPAGRVGSHARRRPAAKREGGRATNCVVPRAADIIDRLIAGHPAYNDELQQRHGDGGGGGSSSSSSSDGRPEVNISAIHKVFTELITCAKWLLLTTINAMPSDLASNIQSGLFCTKSTPLAVSMLY